MLILPIRNFPLICSLWFIAITERDGGGRTVADAAFVSHPNPMSYRTTSTRPVVQAHHINMEDGRCGEDDGIDSIRTPAASLSPKHSHAIHRRNFMARTVTLTTMGTILTPSRSMAQTEQPRLMGTTTSTTATSTSIITAEEESFAELAARANQMSRDLPRQETRSATTTTTSQKTIYDFYLPYEGKDTPWKDLIRQTMTSDGGAKVKAIIVVNLKQDDPIARKTIPELMSIASKYGRDTGAVAIVACPTDQGYYEPDTSQLIRLKLASEYGYGINPATITTDKVNLLGSGAHPFWRWLQANCRTPSGLGRLEGNFEKFLIDGTTGLPVRRYPRKYKPLNMVEDVEAILAGKPLPPPRANWLEEWRAAAVEAERDTYRFQKGLNYYDQ